METINESYPIGNLPILVGIQKELPVLLQYIKDTSHLGAAFPSIAVDVVHHLPPS